LLVYASCWFTHAEPAAFLAAMLNSQPLGFYSPNQVVQDAKGHGVEVRAVDEMCSAVEATL
jgi:error-prone DNA polymerase